MITPPTEWTFRRVVWSTLIFTFVAISFWMIFRFSQVILILFIAFVIGTVVRPLVNWLYGRGLTRMSGTIVAYLLLFAMLAGFLLVLLPLIAEQSGKIIAALPEYYQSLREWMVNYPNQFIARLSLFLPSELPMFGPEQPAGQDALASTEQVVGYVISGVNGVFLAIVVLLMSFHWTLYGSRITQSLTMMFPSGQRERARELINAMEIKLSAFITGQGVLCLAIAIMALIAYVLIDLPNALVLAFIAGVLEAVPVLGPILGAIPAAIIAISVDPGKLIWVIGATVVIQATENYLLVPRIMRRAVGVNPFVALLSLFAFSSLLGMVGALLAIPIAAIVQLLLEHFVFDSNAKKPEASMGRDYVSRLRYETQELIRDLRKQARHRRSGPDLDVKQIDQLVDEIEAIATDLDSVLAKDQNAGGA